MELIIKHFSQLSARELYDILELRVSVFVVEQNCPYQELDDRDQSSYHLYLKDDSGIAAYLRVYFNEIYMNPYIEESDILICARNGSKSLVGKCAVMNDIGEKVSFGAFMAVFRSTCYRYVYHYFNTLLFRSAFDNDDSKQINQVTQAILRDTMIPLPPFAEQERIVSTLDKAFTLVELVDTETENIEVLIKKGMK